MAERVRKLVFIFTSRNVTTEQAHYTFLQSIGQLPAQDWCRQRWQHHTIWVDDASDDSKTFGRAFHTPEHFTFVTPQRRGGLRNLIEQVRWAKENWELEPTDVIVPWDGDDFMAGPHVLRTLARAYETHHPLMTYGGYRLYPELSLGMPERGFDLNYPIRLQTWLCAPPRSFQLQLLDELLESHPEQLIDPATGVYWEAAWDRGLYCPLMELAGYELLRISLPLYLYNHRAPNPTTRGVLGAQAAARVAAMPPLKPPKPSGGRVRVWWGP